MYNVQIRLSSEDRMLVTIGLKSGVYIDSLHRTNVFYTDGDGSWTSISIDTTDSNFVQFRTDSGGQFVVVKETNPGALAGKRQHPI